MAVRTKDSGRNLLEFVLVFLQGYQRFIKDSADGASAHLKPDILAAEAFSMAPKKRPEPKWKSTHL